MVKVFNTTGKEMCPSELARWANTVHRIAGGKGDVFTPDDFDSSNPKNRLRGYMCDCGIDVNGNSKGEFELFSVSSRDVKEGGKAYMSCKKCGAISHL